MNITEMGIVCGLCSGLLIPSGVGLKYYADHEYVTVASQNLSLLYAVEDEIEVIQHRVENGTATAADKTRLATLKERKRHLKK